MISTKEFLHDEDAALTARIFSERPFKSWLDRMHDEVLDDVCNYVYDASFPKISQGVLTQMRDISCAKFGLKPYKLYRTRNYDTEISCVGYNTPAVLIPDSLVDCADEFIQARLFAQAAAIAAGHNKLTFFIWAAENMSGIGGFPIVGTGLIALLYEWNRARKLSLDRAVLLATDDLSLALKNILFGVVPNDILKNFNFGTDADTFLEQMQRYFRHENPMQTVGKVFSYLTDYSWLPRRYDELRKFHRRRHQQ